MQLRMLSFAASLLLTATTTFAQGRVVGTVRNQDAQTVKGATITAFNPNGAPSTTTTTSDAKGRFSFLGLRGGEYTFTVEAPGYEAFQTKANIRMLGTNPVLDVMLKAAPEVAPSGPFATVDLAALQERLDEAAEREKAGNIDEAIAIYREIATRLPALTMVRLQLGMLHERKQDVPAATADYQAVLKSDPSNAKARAALARLSPQGKGTGLQ